MLDLRLIITSRWRHLIPLLPQDSPLFVPDLPGYGISVPIQANDKLSIGNALLSALVTQVKRSSSGSSFSEIPVVLIGHDRGARVAHRLAVSGYPGLNIKAVSLIDIVPTITQWRAGAGTRPTEVVGYFHWPLLANVEQALKMIVAYGGDQWCTDMILRWAGKNEQGLKILKSDNALEVYGAFFKNEHTIRASNEDYKAGADVDLDQQEEDQKSGRKINVPLFLIYSEHYIGSRYDVPKEWEDWVGKEVKIESFAVGNGIGHFDAEEAPEECAQEINNWLKGLRFGS